MRVLEVHRPAVEPCLRVADVDAVVSPLLAGKRARRAPLAHPERGADAERQGEDREDARQERDADLDPAETFSGHLTSLWGSLDGPGTGSGTAEECLDDHLPPGARNEPGAD